MLIVCSGQLKTLEDFGGMVLANACGKFFLHPI